MRVAITGNRHFGNILAKQLSKVDKQNSYRYYDTSEKLFDKILFTLLLPFTDTVYNISASISGGKALELALRFEKRIVQHFIGSDVLKAKTDIKNKKLIKKSIFLCEVEWIQKELKDMGIDAKTRSIFGFEEFIKPKKFERFSVLTYIREGKEEFYGIKDFIKLAKDFPVLKFKIAGIKNYHDLPPNIKCLGWTDMIQELQNSTVFIRNTKHDGLAFSVVEALSLGRVVFYNYDFPYVKYFTDYTTLKNQFERVYHDFKDFQLSVNSDATEFVKKEFNKEKVFRDLAQILCKQG